MISASEEASECSYSEVDFSGGCQSTEANTVTLVNTLRHAQGSPIIICPSLSCPVLSSIDKDSFIDMLRGEGETQKCSKPKRTKEKECQVIDSYARSSVMEYFQMCL